MTITARVQFLSLVIALVSACHGELVPIDDDDGAAPTLDAASASLTWTEDVAPRLDSCTSCHGAAGRYSLESYAESFGPGTDAVPNVIARNSSSALVDYCRRRHGGIGAVDAALIERWIMDGARER